MQSSRRVEKITYCIHCNKDILEELDNNTDTKKVLSKY